jgi:threonine aldolase
MVDRLADDHLRARILADRLSGIPGLTIETNPPQTNMVYLNLNDLVPFSGRDLTSMLEQRGVKVDWVEARRFRLVTHYWIDDASIDRTVAAFEETLERSMI